MLETPDGGAGEDDGRAGGPTPVLVSSPVAVLLVLLAVPCAVAA